MKKPRMRRIFIGLVEIAGYYSNLAHGLKELGYNCEYFTAHSHPFGYGGEDQKPGILRLANWFNKFRGNPQRKLLTRVIIALPGEILFHIWALYAIIKYDVFIFGFGSSLTRGNLDLVLLRWLNKTVISNLAHGSDARPSFIDGGKQSKEGNFPSVLQNYRSAAFMKKRLQRHERFSSVVIGAPFSTSQFAQIQLLNFFALGVPINLSRLQIEDHNLKRDSESISHNAVRILHSPSHPAVKGSALIKVAIDNLKSRGHDIDFVLIQGKPFNKVLLEIQKCDFVVDQVYSDTPMAGFATEAAWFGKPAVVGGYGLNDLKSFVPEGMWPPSKICHPDNIEQAIKDLIINKEERERLGSEAQLFVRTKWNSEEVARRYLRIIQGDIPDEWWINPNDVCYLEGCGQPIERTKENIRGLVEKYGVQSLQLSHRPDLENAFLEFAGINMS